MKGIIKFTAALFFAACLIQAAGAASIDYIVTYDAIQIGNDTWQYDYTIINNSQNDIYALDLFFPKENQGGDTLYQNVSVFNSPAGWESFFFPEVVISGVEISPPVMTWGGGVWDALLEDFVFALWISPGEDLSGFSVTFDWFGEGNPGSQEFELWGTANLDSLYKGLTTSDAPNGDAPSVPEPQSFMLLGTGIIGLAAYYRRWKAGEK